MTPQDFLALVTTHEGKGYFVVEGAESGYFWRLRRYEIRHGVSVPTSVVATLDSCKAGFVLTVAGRYVDASDINTEDGKAWYRCLGTLDDFRRLFQFQGERDSKGALICPTLPAVGWESDSNRRTRKD